METGQKPGEEEAGANSEMDVRATNLEHYRGLIAANEVGKQTVDFNGQTLELALSRFLVRTNNDPRIVNAVRDLLNGLDGMSRLGNEEEALSEGKIDAISEAIKTATETLNSQRIA